MIIDKTNQKCLDSIFEKYNKQQKHINVFAPFSLSPTFFKELICFFLNKQKTVFVSCDEKQEWILDILEILFSSDNAFFRQIKISSFYKALYFAPSKDLLDKSFDGANFDVLILIDPKILLRDYFKTRVNVQNIVITCSGNFKEEDWGMDIEHKREARANQSVLKAINYIISINNSEVIITCPGKIIDIRDICGASAEEQRKLFCSTSNYFYSLLDDYYFQKRSETDKDIILNLQKENEKLRELVKFLKQLLSIIGISRCEIDKAFEEITISKNRLNEAIKRLGNDREAIDQEIAIFEKTVSEKISNITEPLRKDINNIDYYQILLIGYLGENVWHNRLCETSKNFLITARMVFDSMWQMDDKDRLDFTGVCMTLSKVLDIELCRRFYDEYTNWLKQFDIKNWPSTLVYEDKYNKTYSKLRKEYFTLGSIAHLFSEKYKVNNRTYFELAVNFASERLYSNNCSKKDVKDKLKEIVDCTEKIRRDYRNPAAHRSQMYAVDAKGCMDYMIDLYQKLKQILESMVI